MKMENISEMFFIGIMSGLVSGFIILWQGTSPFDFISAMGLLLLSLGILCVSLCENSQEKTRGSVFIVIGLMIGVSEWIFNLLGL